MMYQDTVHNWLRRSLLRQAGLDTVTMAELDESVALKRCATFYRLRNARLRMGHLRYDVYGWSPSNDLLARAVLSLSKYSATGNREHLVDAANFCELEWVHPSREGTYYHAEDRTE
jgi:hypothetical protein